MMKKIIILIIGIALMGTLGWFGFRYYTCSGCGSNSPLHDPIPVLDTTILSFKDCEGAGNPIMESYPRQCKTSDGRTFIEELPEKITYINATSGMIIPELPFPGAVTGKEFIMKGKARGVWYFEASFPVVILDKDGKVLVSSPAQAQGDWMTSEFVPFTATMTIPVSYQGKATVILKKDNPSGLPENDASISFPITIEY